MLFRSWKGLTRHHRVRLRGSPPGEVRIEREVAGVGICRRVDLVIVLLSLSPKREHVKPPVVTNIFSLVGSSKPVFFVVSPTLSPFFFLLEAFIRLVRDTMLAESLFRLITGLFWATFASPYPFPSTASTVPSLITTVLPFCSCSLIGIDTQNADIISLKHVGETGVGRTERGKRVVVMRLDPDH